MQQHERPTIPTVVPERDADAVTGDHMTVTSHPGTTSHDAGTGSSGSATPCNEPGGGH
jgi:hypothetical protein